MFCIKHAAAMPRVAIENVVVTELGDELRAVDVEFRNLRAIPTRTARASEKNIGRPDAYTLSGKRIRVVAGGFRRDRWRPERIELAEREPERLLRERGIGSRDVVRVRWFVRGSGSATIGWEGEKARNVSEVVRLR